MLSEEELQKLQARLREYYASRTVTESGAVFFMDRLMQQLLLHREQLIQYRAAVPDRCPITGREFVDILKHPERGYVPVYGTHFRAYTIPELDEQDRSLTCQWYDYDDGAWGEYEMTGLFLMREDEDLGPLYEDQEAARLAREADRPRDAD